MVMDATPSPQSVGREFVRQYYTLLNKAPNHLHRFYNNSSSFVHGGLDSNSREATLVIGQKQIHHKIQQLNFRDCHAKISQVDSQATLGNGVVVQVTGELSNDGQPMRRFTQTFVLAAQSPKKYYVHNDIFRYQDVYADDDIDENVRSDVEEEHNPEQQENNAVITDSNNTAATATANSNQQNVLGGGGGGQHQPIYYTTTSVINSGPILQNFTTQQPQQQQQQQPQQLNGVHDDLLKTQGNPMLQAATTGVPPNQQQQPPQPQQQLPSGNLPVDLAASMVQQQQQSVVPQQQQQQQTLEPTDSIQSNINNLNDPDTVLNDQQQISSLDASNDIQEQQSLHKEIDYDDDQQQLQQQQQQQQPIIQSNEPKTYANLVKSGGALSFASATATGANMNYSSRQPILSPPPIINKYQSEPQRQDNNSGIGGGVGLGVGRNPLEQRTSNRSIRGNSSANIQRQQDSRPGYQRQNYNDEERRQSNSNSNQLGDNHQLFLGNIPHHATEEELKALFSKFGTVNQLRILSKSGPKTPGGRAPPNYGFITYDDPQSVKNCLSNMPLYFPDNSPEGQKLNVEEKKTRMNVRGPGESGGRIGGNNLGGNNGQNRNLGQPRGNGGPPPPQQQQGSINRGGSGQRTSGGGGGGNNVSGGNRGGSFNRSDRSSGGGGGNNNYGRR
uniref:Putative rasputin n=1 Tax=Corethrella appendiculata TaxID=1370023 RepID=U5ER35_9DIPT